LSLDWEKVKPLELNASQTAKLAELAPILAPLLKFWWSVAQEYPWGVYVSRSVPGDGPTDLT